MSQVYPEKNCVIEFHQMCSPNPILSCLTIRNFALFLIKKGHRKKNLVYSDIVIEHISDFL